MKGPLKATGMSDLKLTPSLLSMLERIERYSGSLLMLAVTASGGPEYTKLNKLLPQPAVLTFFHVWHTNHPSHAKRRAFVSLTKDG